MGWIEYLLIVAGRSPGGFFLVGIQGSLLPKKKKKK